MPVANVPLIKYQLELIKRYGIYTVILAVSPRCQRYRKFFESSEIKLSISCEKSPLGTAGGIKNAARYLKESEPFFVFNGDILSDCNLKKMLSQHKKNKADVSIAVVSVENPKDFGVIVVDDSYRIKQFIEKPAQPVSNLINAGIYIINPDILDLIPSGREVSIEKETFPLLISSGKRIFAYKHTGYWMDMGTVEKFKKANFDILEGSFKLKINSPSIIRKGQIMLGKDVAIGKNVKFEGNVVIGDNCRIGDNSIIKNSILFKDVFVGDGCSIADSIIGNSVIIQNNCEIKNLAVSDRSKINRFTRIINS